MLTAKTILPIVSKLLFPFCISGFAYGQVSADFSVNKIEGCAPLVVQFSDLSTGSITSRSWSFGNGNTSTLEDPGATYTIPGTYTIELVVSNGTESDTETKISYITVFAVPKADFVADEVIVCNPTEVSFTDNSTYDTDPITSWFWNFGDGKFSSDPSPSNIYETGVYTVYLTVEDDNGCASFVSEYQHITVQDVAASFNYQANICPIPAEVNLSSTSSGNNINNSWDFGDGTFSSDPSPTHSYTSYGTYDVKLVSTDDIGCKDSLIKKVNILDYQADFDFTVDCSTDGYNLSFSDLSPSISKIWKWDFGDGGSSSQQNPNHWYSSSDPISITLISGPSVECQNTVVKTYTPPNALFYVDSFACESPVFRLFNNQSTGEGITYEWDFGDGSPTESTEHPSHSFSSASVIDSSVIVLTITDVFGCSHSFSKTILIKEPYANFNTDIYEGCAPLDVNFSDNSDSEDPIISWEWGFGDGGTSIDQNPSYTYNDTGYFDVELVIITSLGCTDTLVFEDYIRAGQKPDYISFTDFDTLCFHNGEQWFGTAGYTDPNIDITDWYWEFAYIDDPNYSPTTFYEQNPIFNVRDNWSTGELDILFVAGHNGCVDSLVKSVITVAPVSLWENDGTDWAFCSAPAVVNLQNASDEYTSMGNMFITHLASGQTTHLNSDPNISNVLNLTRAGVYALTIVSHNDTTKIGGCTDFYPDARLIIDSVYNEFHSSINEGCLNGNGVFPVSFIDSSKSFYDQIDAWDWDFGDGYSTTNGTLSVDDGYGNITETDIAYTDLINSSNNNDGLTSGSYQNPTHIYQDTGTYIVTRYLRTQMNYIRNGGDEQDVFCGHVFRDTIKINGAFSGFEVGDLTSCPNTLLQFTDTSTTTFPNITSRKWDFGDGTFSTDVNPTHSYSTTGDYSVSLAIENSSGCKDTLIKSTYIEITKPISLFTSNTVNGCDNEPVQFYSQATGSIVSYYWTFGDGFDSSLKDPKHLYVNDGTYTVSLTVTDENGCDSTLSSTDYIVINQKPIADFTSDALGGDCPPLPITFNDASTGNINSWNWSFGDGGTSALEMPNHIYTEPGSFDVQLIIRNDAGCKDTLVKSNFISLGGPLGTFTTDILSDCVPFDVIFTANATNTTTYSWDFGDGTVVSSASGTHTQTYINRGVFTPLLFLEDNLECQYIVPSTLQIIANGLYADFNSSETILCDTGNVAFLNESIVFYPTEYLWDFGDTESSNTVSPNHNYSEAGIYDVSLYGEDEVGCSSTITKQIEVFVKPDLTLDVNTDEWCVPFDLKVNVDNTNPTIINTWQWDFGNEIIVSENPLEYTLTSANIYEITLTAGYANETCLLDTTVSVIAHSSPVANFSYSPSSELSQHQLIQFNNESERSTSWNWGFDDGIYSDSKNPSHSYDLVGDFMVQLIAYNEIGCSDSVKNPLQIAPLIPNVFTPNGDGSNERFTIDGIEDQGCLLQVFNRWGVLIFERDNYYNQWTGTKTNGQTISSGTYYYVISSCEHLEKSSGYITVFGK